MRPSTVYFSVTLAAQALGLPGVLPDAKAYAVNTLSQVENVAKELEINTPNIFNQEVGLSFGVDHAVLKHPPRIYT
jgi:hypothetical protein